MTLTTAWMWATNDGEVNGATIDPEDGRIFWFDSGIGCACGDSSTVQNFEQFEQRGAAFSGVPDDVLTEMKNTLDQLRNADA